MNTLLVIQVHAILMSISLSLLLLLTYFLYKRVGLRLQRPSRRKYFITLCCEPPAKDGRTTLRSLDSSTGVEAIIPDMSNCPVVEFETKFDVIHNGYVLTPGGDYTQPTQSGELTLNMSLRKRDVVIIVEHLS